MNCIINFQTRGIKGAMAYLPSTATGVSVGGTVCKGCRADGGGRMEAEGLSPCLRTLTEAHGCTFIILCHEAGVPEMMSSRAYSSHPVPIQGIGSSV